jgi:hypothetical protein
VSGTQTEAIVDTIRELEEEPPGHVLVHAIDEFLIEVVEFGLAYRSPGRGAYHRHVDHALLDSPHACDGPIFTELHHTLQVCHPPLTFQRHCGPGGTLAMSCRS